MRSVDEIRDEMTKTEDAGQRNLMELTGATTGIDDLRRRAGELRRHHRRLVAELVEAERREARE